MGIYLSNRDGGLTDEQGHLKFISSAFSGGVIGDGLAVTQNSPLGMYVLVGEGDARIAYDNYAYQVWIEGSEVVTVSTASSSNPRIDRLVLYVDRDEDPDNETPNNPTIAKLALVAGTPAGSPSRPSDGAVNTAVSNNPWIDLADIAVGTSVTQITNSNITRTATSVIVPKNSVNSDALKTKAVTSPKIDFDSGVWWEELGRTTLGTAGSTIDVTSLPAREYLRIILKVYPNGGTYSGALRFNNDSGSNYAIRVSTNGGSDTTVGSLSAFSGFDTGAVDSSDMFTVIEVRNQANREKIATGTLVRNATGAGNAPGRREIQGKWANTSDQITRITAIVGTGTGNYGVGSELIVLGHN